MMQANEIQQRFSRIEQAIGQATQSSMSDTNTPPQLKDCIQKLDRQTRGAKEVIRSGDESRIRQCVEDLEMLGDEAKRVCGTSAQVAAGLKQAVNRVHEELSDLKHQLH